MQRQQDAVVVLTVFVRDVPGHVSTAAEHLARALVLRRTTTRRSSVAVIVLSDDRVWPQSLRMLDHDDKDEEESAVVGRCVLLSLLPLLSSPTKYVEDVLERTDRISRLVQVLPPRHATLLLLVKHGAIEILFQRASQEKDVVTRRDILAILNNLLELYMIDGTSVKRTAVYLLKATVDSLDISSLDTRDSSNTISITTDDNSNNPMAVILEQLEFRSTMAIEIVKSLCCNSNVNKHADDNDHDDNIPPSPSATLASRLFQLVLTLFYSTTISANTTTEQQQQQQQQQCFVLQSCTVRLASMVILPMLCEQVSVDILLLPGSSEDGCGILGMVGWIIDCACHDTNTNEDDDTSAIPTKDDTTMRMSLLDRSEGWDIEKPTSTTTTKKDYSQLDHYLQQCLPPSSPQQTASLCLGLLVAMLELGNTKRPAQEEETLQRFFLPLLRRLASDSTDADMAEMAAHAGALIASRAIVGEEEEQQLPAAPSTPELARRDLESSLPPLRARGALRVLRMARAITATHDNALVVDVTNDNKPQQSQQLALFQLLDVALLALSDDESYVYLAAVQALSALGDTRPSTVLPLLIEALVRGTMTTSMTTPSHHLTITQRVKIAEALVFTLRRRGRAIASYVSSGCLEELVRGCGRNANDDNDTPSAETNQRMRTATHSYFVDDDNDEDDERRTRLHTGGPLFEAEEVHAVRSGCFVCLSEIVSVLRWLPPSLLERHCGRMIDLCTHALRLDRTRPVRRAAALLTANLYRYLLVVATEQDDEDDNNGWAVVAAEFVACGEENLFVTLTQCVSDDKADPSTTARCREAIECRQSCVDLGLFAAGAVLAKARQMEESSRSQLFLQQMLDITGRRDSSNTTNFLNKGRLNSKSLQLEFDK